MSEMSAGVPTPEQPQGNAPQSGQPRTQGTPGGVKKRRRGKRGGRNRNKTRVEGAAGQTASNAPSGEPGQTPRPSQPRAPRPPRQNPVAQDIELPDPPREGMMASPEAAEAALVRKPQIGDTRPAPASTATTAKPEIAAADGEAKPKSRNRRGGKRGGRNRRKTSDRSDNSVAGTDAELIERRRGKERNGKAVGRYMMCVQVREEFTQVAMLEGRSLIEHYVSRPADDETQIHGNIYLGRVQNVLPGMEAAFVDIGTQKNAVLYRGDVQFDKDDVVEQGPDPRIEQVLKSRQMILCQVTKNPIAAKGGRLTQEVSLPGRFVVLIPDSRTYGISKRLPEGERRRLRGILDRIKPEQHGIIVRTAAENATEHELTTDLTRLIEQWNEIRAKAEKASSPTLLYREPPLAVRVIREEFSSDYRGIVIDDPALFEEVRDYIGAFNPEFADRIELYDAEKEGLPLFEQHRVHEQLRKALDRKVWLPSGGSLIIEHTEALTVIDVNTGKNVGKSNLEETVFHNNLEAAEEIARQLRLRDIGGIIVIDFIDMEIRENRRKVLEAFKDALSRDKTRTQVFEISELGLVEMTRKRIGEGLLTNFADPCVTCEGRGVMIDLSMLD
jgi:ribonuclease E